MGDADEKRRSERFQILGPLQGEVMVFQPITVREISRGGAQIETVFPLHLDSLHDLRLTFGENSVIVKGRVAHCHISDVDHELVVYRSGVEFIAMSEPVSDVIIGFIDAIKDGRRS